MNISGGQLTNEFVSIAAGPCRVAILRAQGGATFRAYIRAVSCDAAEEAAYLAARELAGLRGPEAAPPPADVLDDWPVDPADLIDLTPFILASREDDGPNRYQQARGDRP